jgi:hypothetical protein
VSEVSLSSELYLAPEMMYVSLGRLSNSLNNFLQFFLLIMCSSECTYQCVYDAALVGLIKVLPIWKVVRIRYVYPGFRFAIRPGSRILDIGSNNNSKRRRIKLVVLPLFVALYFKKLKIIKDGKRFESIDKEFQYL